MAFIANVFTFKLLRALLPLGLRATALMKIPSTAHIRSILPEFVWTEDISVGRRLGLLSFLCLDFSMGLIVMPGETTIMFCRNMISKV